MTKKDLERRNEYLLLQLKNVNETLNNLDFCDMHIAMRSIGFLLNISDSETIKNRLEFIEEYNQSYNFYDKDKNINDYK